MAVLENSTISRFLEAKGMIDVGVSAGGFGILRVIEI